MEGPTIPRFLSKNGLIYLRFGSTFANYYMRKVIKTLHVTVTTCPLCYLFHLAVFKFLFVDFSDDENSYNVFLKVSGKFSRYFSWRQVAFF